MKSLITNQTGGFIIAVDDLEIIQNNVKELTSAISKGLAFNETAIILSGCDITVNGSGGGTPTLDLTAGAIWYLDEVYIVDAVVGQGLPALTTQTDVELGYEWDLAETTTTAVIFGDALTKDVHKYRKSVLVLTPVTWTGLSALKHIDEIFLRGASTSQTGVVALATSTEVKDNSGSNKVVTANLLSDHNFYSGSTLDAAMYTAYIENNTGVSNLFVKSFNNGTVLVNGSIKTVAVLSSAVEIDIIDLTAAPMSLSTTSDTNIGVGYDKLNRAIMYTVIAFGSDKKVRLQRLDGANMDESKEIYIQIYLT